MQLLVSVVTGRQPTVDLSDPEGWDPGIPKDRVVVAQESTIYLSFAGIESLPELLDCLTRVLL